ncbi:hypothetical protein [Brevundimonas mediterranea]|uniref:Putative membrane protein n=1 Tax=Brevundimonas mediterranea TaxID=74329 RepID=A0A7W6A4P9_9CAUL|nr:hypothetical protein [Brevundimonas mediterranea]MBB3873303.1 putative membrane protein [Brevundimonas mediterranea]
MTTEPNFTAGQEPEGKVAALIAWALFILSIPSANVLVLVGLVVSYVARGTAVGVARQHIDSQIRLFWSVIWWTVALWIGIIISIPLAAIGIGIITGLLCGLALFLLSVWFTVKSVLGLINLLQDKPI